MEKQQNFLTLDKSYLHHMGYKVGMTMGTASQNYSILNSINNTDANIIYLFIYYRINSK